MVIKFSVLFLSIMTNWLLLSCGDSKSDQELAASLKQGARVYRSKCLTCHMANGKGVPSVYPPLAGSDYLLADQERAIRQILYGAQGEMIVNGQIYNGLMPAPNLSDQETADVLNYILNSWGNQSEIVTAPEVAKQRKK
jgi:mono/diheme cytochrome c family protein